MQLKLKEPSEIWKEPSVEWKDMTPDEKLDWLKSEIDDLVILVERLYGTVAVTRRGVSELRRASAKKIRRASR